jgi:hypothetical protein
MEMWRVLREVRPSYYFNTRPDLSSERAPHGERTATFRKQTSNRKQYLVTSSKVGSIPWHSDWLTVSRKVTSALTSRGRLIVTAFLLTTFPLSPVLLSSPTRYQMMRRRLMPSPMDYRHKYSSLNRLPYIAHNTSHIHIKTLSILTV